MVIKKLLIPEDLFLLRAYPQSVESTSHPHILFMIHFNITFQYMPLSYKISLTFHSSIHLSFPRVTFHPSPTLGLYYLLFGEGYNLCNLPFM